VLIGATDEILCELKNEKTKDKGTIFFLCQTVYKIFILEKRAVVESMLGTLQDSSYYFLCNLSKKITDYQTQSAEALQLDDLMFDGGSHFMTNKKCNLPTGSTRTTKKGYEEVYVPPPTKPPAHGEKLIAITDMPKYTHPAFEGGVLKIREIFIF